MPNEKVTQLLQLLHDCPIVADGLTERSEQLLVSLKNNQLTHILKELLGDMPFSVNDIQRLLEDASQLALTIDICEDTARNEAP
jgi:hypothetical protein